MHQLPPLQAKPVFMFNETDTSEGLSVLDLWHKFKLAEITEIMRQKGDTIFIELLNKRRVGAVDVSVGYISNHYLYNNLKGSIHTMHCIFL